jgi:tRNA G18 (ribose-2'-O)-methylase SpoU
MPGGISKTKWQSVRRLRHRRGREASGALLVEGARAVETALTKPHRVALVMLGPVASAHAPSIAQEAATHNIAVVELTAEQTEELSGTVTSQQVFAVANWRPRTDLPADFANLILHLSGIRDPRNMGPILRTAAALSAAVTCAPDCVDVTHPDTVRSGAAAYFDAPLYAEVRLATLSERAPSHSVVYASAHGGRNLPDFVWPERCILVLGGEAAGATERVRDYVTVTIPSRIESLNTSVAGAILLWDHFRSANKVKR